MVVLLVVGGLSAAAVSGEGIGFAAIFGAVVGVTAGVIWFRFAPAVRAGYDEAGDTVAARQRGFDAVASLGEPIATLGALRVFDSPPSLVAIPADMAAGEVLTWPITSEVRAEVEAVGSVSMTRDRNLAAKALGATVVPGGVFLFGNVKERVHDNRDLYLGIEGPTGC